MVVWPKPTPGNARTPSPIMDALSSKTTELDESRAKLSADALIEEDRRSKQWQKSKPG